jgi:hypothetical protein
MTVLDGDSRLNRWLPVPPLTVSRDEEERDEKGIILCGTARVGLILCASACGSQPTHRCQEHLRQLPQPGGGRRFEPPISPPVDVVQIADRTHMSIWHKLGEEGDPTSERVIAFVRSEAARSK